MSLTNLLAYLSKTAHLSGVSALLSWDQETFMPNGAIEARSQQHAVLAKCVHDRKTASEYGDLLNQCIDIESSTIQLSDLSPSEERMLEELRNDYIKSNALPSSFVEEFASVSSQSQHSWVEARAKSDFSLFKPHLEKVIELSKRKAAYLRESGVYSGAENLSDYDILMDEFEPGMRTSHLTPLLVSLKQFTLDILPKVMDAQRSTGVGTSLSAFSWNEDAQWDFGINMLRKMGYSFERGRQDKSTHPFTINFHPTDVRITTRMNEHDFFEGWSSSVHEGGHALYEQGLNMDYFGTPLCEATSLGVHESQSRLWENLVAKSTIFWEGHYPELQKQFSFLDDVSLQNFISEMNKVSPGPIRVESDELTYNLHIIIRYEIEQAIFNDGISIDDLPALWNDKYEHYLGLRPESDAQGILQDVHWSGAAFGYFPTYSIGNLMSSQLWDAAKQAIPRLESHIRDGEFTDLLTWLTKNVFKVGRAKTGLQLIEAVTGKALSIAPFERYIQSKYQH